MFTQFTVDKNIYLLKDFLFTLMQKDCNAGKLYELPRRKS